MQKKDLTQEQIESLLEDQFRTLGVYETVTMLAAIVFLIAIWPLIGINFATLPLWFMIAWWIATGMAYHKIRLSIRARRVRKTIEAMRAL